MQFTTQKKHCQLLILLVLNSILSAQSFQKKDVAGSAGIGLTHLNKSLVRLQTQKENFKQGFKGDVHASVRGTNPLILKYEYAISKYFSLGFSFAWYSIEILVKDDYNIYYNSQPVNHVEDSYNYWLSSGSLGIRPNYHIPLKKIKSDLFVGCAIGFTKNHLVINVSSTSGAIAGFADVKLPNGLYYAPTLGYRYYFANNLAFNAEIGYERGALAEVGLAFRFRPYHYEPLK